MRPLFLVCAGINLLIAATHVVLWVAGAAPFAPEPHWERAIDALTVAGLFWIARDAA